MPYKDHPNYTPNLESKLDLRPLGGYEESLEALDFLLEDKYETVRHAAAEMHPRVSHEVFRYPGLDQDDSVVLEAEMVETVQEVLEDNSDKESGWFDEKLFNLGYRRMPKSPNLRKLHRSPYMNHVSDSINIPSTPFSNPYSQGKKKSESDFHYHWANNFLIQSMAEQEIVFE